VNFSATNSVSDNSQTAKLVEIIVPSVVALLLLLAGLVICVIKAKKNRKAIPSALNNGQVTPFGQRNHTASALNNWEITPFWQRNHVAASNDAQDNNSMRPAGQGNHQDLDLPSFVIETILYATNNFSADNKLGQGGFGPVYMVMYCLSLRVRTVKTYDRHLQILID
jgi:hypothetical protein